MADDDAGKKSKASVGYKRGGDHCGACQHWIESAEDEGSETGECELVAGAIGEDMWCRLFKRKRATIAQGASSPGTEYEQ